MECFSVEIDLLGTCLAGEEMTIRLAVIKDIPFSVYESHASVGIAAIVQCFGIAVRTDVRI